MRRGVDSRARRCDPLAGRHCAPQRAHRGRASNGSPKSLKIDRETQLCISLASRPGNFGNRFHNFLYEALALNFVYKSCTTEDLSAAIAGVQALGIRGCGLSMPFKSEAIAIVEELGGEIEPPARRIGAINTIVNTQGKLKGYNTDAAAVVELIAARGIPNTARTVVFGSGGMARAVISALLSSRFKDVMLIARNIETSQAIANEFGIPAQPAFPARSGFEFLINCSPLGMTGSPGMPFPEEVLKASRFVCDVVAQPAQSALLARAQALGKGLITGVEITAIQAREQFRLYTGISPDAALLARAIAHASQG